MFRIGRESLGSSGSRWITLVAWSSVLALLVLVLASCAKPPEAELTAAEADLDRARANEAEIYAPAEFHAAEDSLAAARNEVDRQSAKFALFRGYGEAKKKAAAAQAAAQRAAEAAVQNKEAMRQDAEQALAEATQLLADVRGKLDSPVGKRLSRAKEAREAIEQIRSELDATEAALENVRAAQAEERFHDASRIATESLNKLRGLDEEVTGAIERVTAGS